jgi:hypothetical protein
MYHFGQSIGTVWHILIETLSPPWPRKLQLGNAEIVTCGLFIKTGSIGIR